MILFIMSFYLCTVEGCNNKYKTEKKWILHMNTKHDIENAQLPNKVEINKNGNRSNSQLIEDEKIKLAKMMADRRSELEEKAKRKVEERIKHEYEQKYMDMERKKLELEEQELKHKEDALKLEQEQLNQYEMIKQRMINNEDNKCIICFDRDINACPNPCGHLQFCYICLVNTKEYNRGCPICRKNIDSIINISIKFIFDYISLKVKIIYKNIIIYYGKNRTSFDSNNQKGYYNQ